jgi:hypothetical protein
MVPGSTRRTHRPKRRPHRANGELAAGSAEAAVVASEPNSRLREVTSKVRGSRKSARDFAAPMARPSEVQPTLDWQVSASPQHRRRHVAGRNQNDSGDPALGLMSSWAQLPMWTDII